MARLTIGFGVLLILIGVAGYIGTGATHMTALIPAFLGLPVVIAGVLALDEKKRKHAMHAALAIALLGLLGTLPGLLKLPVLLSGGNVVRPAAVVDQAVTAILCAAFLAIGIRSFMSARRSLNK